MPEEKNRGGSSHDSQHPTPAEKRVEAFGNQSALGLELPLTMAGAVIFVGLLGYADRGALHLVLWHAIFHVCSTNFCGLPRFARADAYG